MGFQLDLWSLLIGAVVGIFPELIAGFFLWKRWFAKANEKRLQDSIIEGKFDDAIVAIFKRGLDLLWEPMIHSGKQDDKGKPILISPVDRLASDFGFYIVQRLKSAAGVDARKRQVAQGDVIADLQNPDSPLSSLQTFLPSLAARAVEDGDYVPILLEMARPFVEKYISEKIGNISAQQGGQSGGWG